MAIAGLVLGIVSLGMVFTGISPAWFLTYGGLAVAIVGLVLSVIAGKKKPSGIATAGVIIGIAAVVLNGIFGVACGVCVGTVACVIG